MFVFACGEDDIAPSDPCGDGYCGYGETTSSCPRDCTLLCVPGETRCDGNVFLTCSQDGQTETIQACEPGEYCTTDGCVNTPDMGFDSTPDLEDDLALDVVDDVGDDTPNDVTDDNVDDAPDDAPGDSTTEQD